MNQELRDSSTDSVALQMTRSTRPLVALESKPIDIDRMLSSMKQKLGNWSTKYGGPVGKFDQYGSVANTSFVPATRTIQARWQPAAQQDYSCSSLKPKDADTDPETASSSSQTGSDASLDPNIASSTKSNPQPLLACLNNSTDDDDDDENTDPDFFHPSSSASSFSPPAQSIMSPKDNHFKTGTKCASASVCDHHPLLQPHSSPQPFTAPLLHTWSPPPKPLMTLSQTVGANGRTTQSLSRKSPASRITSKSRSTMSFPVKLCIQSNRPIKKPLFSSSVSPKIHSATSSSFSGSSSLISVSKSKLSVSFSDLPETDLDNPVPGHTQSSTPVSYFSNKETPQSCSFSSSCFLNTKRGILKLPSESFPFDDQVSVSNRFDSHTNQHGPDNGPRARPGPSTSGVFKENAKLHSRTPKFGVFSRPKEFSKEEKKRLEKLHEIAFRGDPSSCHRLDEKDETDENTGLYKSDGINKDDAVDTSDGIKEDTKTKATDHTPNDPNSVGQLQPMASISKSQPFAAGIDINEIAKSLKTFFTENSSLKPKQSLENTDSDADSSQLTQPKLATAPSLFPQLAFTSTPKPSPSSRQTNESQATPDISDARIALAQMLQSSRLRSDSPSSKSLVSPSSHPPSATASSPPSFISNTSFNDDGNSSYDHSVSFFEIFNTSTDKAISRKARWEYAANAILKTRNNRRNTEPKLPPFVPKASSFSSCTFFPSVNKDVPVSEKSSLVAKSFVASPDFPVKRLADLPSSSVFVEAINRSNNQLSRSQRRNSLANASPYSYLQFQERQHQHRQQLKKKRKRISLGVGDLGYKSSTFDTKDENYNIVSEKMQHKETDNDDEISDTDRMYSDYDSEEDQYLANCNSSLKDGARAHSSVRFYKKRKVARRTFHSRANSTFPSNSLPSLLNLSVEDLKQGLVVPGDRHLSANATPCAEPSPLTQSPLTAHRNATEPLYDTGPRHESWQRKAETVRDVVDERKRGTHTDETDTESEHSDQVYGSFSETGVEQGAGRLQAAAGEPINREDSSVDGQHKNHENEDESGKAKSPTTGPAQDNPNVPDREAECINNLLALRKAFWK